MLSGANGLYRYDINDVVEVQGFEGRTPRIRFVRKGRDMVSITGEKLHLNQIQAATRDAERATGLLVWQFQVIPDVPARRYDLLLETHTPIGSPEVARAFLATVDTSLASSNVEYASKRRSRRLLAPRLHLMRAGWADRRCRADFRAGKREAQYKWPAIRDAWDEEEPRRGHREHHRCSSIPFTPNREFIADQLARMTRFHCPVTLVYELDMTETLAALEKARAAGAEVSLTALLVKATGLVLERHPRSTGTCSTAGSGGSRSTFDEVSCTLVIRREGPNGEEVLFPVLIRTPDRLSIPEIHRVIRHHQEEGLERLPADGGHPEDPADVLARPEVLQLQGEERPPLLRAATTAATACRSTSPATGGRWRAAGWPTPPSRSCRASSGTCRGSSPGRSACDASSASA